MFFLCGALDMGISKHEISSTTTLGHIAKDDQYFIIRWDYIESIVSHSGVQIPLKAVVEGIKILAVKAFLEHLGNQYLNHPNKISKWVIREETVWAPIKEEIFFRLGLLKVIYLVQKYFNNGSVQIASTLYGSLQQKNKDDDQKTPIIIYPPIVEECLYRVYRYIFTGMSQILSGAHSFKNLGDADELAKAQCFFRIHFAALIFAAAHLLNPHPNKVSALTQFLGAFIGGLSYGYLTEKYQSLAPAILSHGINNCLANACEIYSKEVVPWFITAIITNRMVSFIFGMT